MPDISIMEQIMKIILLELRIRVSFERKCRECLRLISPFRQLITFADTFPDGAGEKVITCTSQQILDTNHKKIYNKKLSVSQISVRNATCDIELASDSLTNKLDAVH